MKFPDVGNQVLRLPIAQNDFEAFKVCVVRDLNDYQKVVALRATTFMAEQDCPFAEEFDGNDLNAMHLLAYKEGEPIATLRLRWYANFGKIERVCVHKSLRGTKAVRVLLAHAFEISARKGYRVMTAQIQSRLVPLWSKLLKCKLRKNRPLFEFSKFDYREIDILIPPHPHKIHINIDPFILIRPEGEWDQVGVLESTPKDKSAAEKAA